MNAPNLTLRGRDLRAEIDRLRHLEREYHDALRALLSEQQRMLEERRPVVHAPAAVQAPDATGDLRSVA